MTITEIKAANAAAGHYFFSPDTMRFFDSRVLSETHGRYFVTSERFDETTPRLYTVRRLDEDGSVSTIGDFQQYKTADSAKRAAFRKSVQEIYATA